MKYTIQEMTRSAVGITLPDNQFKSIIFTSTPDDIGDREVLNTLIYQTVSIRYFEKSIYYNPEEIVFYEDKNEDGSCFQSYMKLSPEYVTPELLTMIKEDPEDREMIKKVVKHVMEDNNV